MAENTFKSMETGGGEYCDPPKMRGGLTLNNTNWGPAGAVGEVLDGNFDFNFECICATTVIIPLPVSAMKTAALNFFRSKAPAWILQWLKAGRGIVFDRIKKKTLEELRRKLAPIRAKYQDLLMKKAAGVAQSKALKKQMREIEQTLANNGVRIDQIRQSAQKAGDMFRRLGCSAIGNTSDWVDLVNNPIGGGGTIVTSDPELRKYAECLKWARQLVPAKQQIAQITAENENLKNLTKSIAKKQAEIERISKEFSKTYQKKIELEQQENIWDVSATDTQDLDQLLDSLPPEVQAGFWDQFWDGFFWVLEVTTILQKKNCLDNQSGLPDGMSGASLNEDTCKCSVCSGRHPKLCDVSNFVGDALPSTPGSRASDEFNVCIECCDSAIPKARWFTGGIIGDVVKEFGVSPCTCECPEFDEGYAMEWVDCPDGCERGVFTSDKKACRRKEFHYVGQNYSWDPDTCTYVCNDPCGEDCCTSQQCCNGSVCGPCESPTTECPPGYRAVESTTNLMSAQEIICLPDCTTSYFPCGEGYCCVENPIINESNEIAHGTNQCLPCDECCIPDLAFGGETCGTCPDKIKTIRFEN